MGFTDYLQNSLGGLLGGSTNAGLQQQKFANTAYGTGWFTTTATADTIRVGDIAYIGYGEPEKPAKKQGPESALEWLDRRVSEMRVAL